MSELTIAIKELQNVVSNIEQIAIKEFEEEAKTIADLNRQQLKNKTDAEGNATPVYSSSNKKKRGRLDFLDKGNFKLGIKSLFDTEGIEMTSTDRKVSFLNPYFHKTSGSIVDTLGLSPDSIDTITIKVNEELIKAIKQLLK